MKKFRRTFGLVAAGALLAGCANIKTPLDTNLDETELGSKTGEAHWQSVLSLVAWGDSGTQAAAADGGIHTVRHADQKTFAILYGLLYLRRTTVVYGD